MDTKHLKPLIAALDDGCYHRPHEMLGFFLSHMMSLWGLPEWQCVPETVQPKIHQAIEAYSHIVSAQKPFMDVLGPLYMELASHGGHKQLGQFFTPWGIASMMTRMTVGEKPEDNGQPLRVCDPACGSGVLLLAWVNHALFHWGEDALPRLAVTGCDIDPYCARIMAVQLVANCNIFKLKLGEILILCGNTLVPSQGLETIIHATAYLPQDSPPSLAPAPERLAAAAPAHADAFQYELFAR